MEKRKNIALRSAVVLCVLVLFCAAFVGGTFARYTTNDNAMDSARVAKWGITVVAGGSLFGADYAAGTTANSIVATTSLNVSAFQPTGDPLPERENIVAPGTTADQGMIIKLSGTPEVEYDVTATSSADVEQVFLGAGSWGVMVVAEGVTADNYTPETYYVFDDVNDVYEKETGVAVYSSTTTYYEVRDAVTLGADYLPMVWSVTPTGKLPALDPDVVDMRNLAEVVAAINNNISAADGKANVAIDGSYTLKWAWAFDENEVAAQNSGADTILGNLAAGLAVVMTDDTGATYTAPEATDYNLNVHYDINVTVVQVN